MTTSLEPILKPTYGVIVYQEQVMQIVQSVGGFSLGEADIIRRAMGKKQIEYMNQKKDLN
jgi:DNA polymerase-3 subunit alpha